MMSTKLRCRPATVSKIVQKPVLSPFRVHIWRRNIDGVGYLAIQPGSIGAFGGRDLVPTAICNAGNWVLSSRDYRGLGFRQPDLHRLASHREFRCGPRRG